MLADQHYLAWAARVGKWKYNYPEHNYKPPACARLQLEAMRRQAYGGKDERGTDNHSNAGMAGGGAGDL